ncbi:lymphocyte antigen 6I-like isoform X2 [Mastomys coucha]|nr:lymphocyte antigen 6I-like isoform X2 [Mastomys coucha]
MNSSHAMKSGVLIFLVALLCAESAQGLECYKCPPEGSCSITTCPYPDAFCVTQEREDSQRKKEKIRHCLSYCPTDYEGMPTQDPNVTMKTSCCKEDLCNAAVPTGGRTWTIAGVLLFSLGSVLLQTLL